MLPATAAQTDAASEMACKLQDPLANIRAIMTDNSVGFDTGDDGGTSYGFQTQPVYAIDLPDKGFTLIPRAVIPVVGLEPGTRVRNVGVDGDPIPAGGDRSWGLGDSVVQLFFAPHSDGQWKWGIGPQLSAPTHTDDDLKGPGWGAGVSGIITGPISENLAFAAIVSNHWGFDGETNAAAIQPMFFYNFPSSPGAYLAYNAVISADWKADSDNRWTVPLGFSLGKAFDMGNGRGLDIMMGPYYNVVRPDGAARWQLRFAVNLLFP